MCLADSSGVLTGKPSRDSGTTHDQQYVKSVIELHDKYLQVLHCTVLLLNHFAGPSVDTPSYHLHGKVLQSPSASNCCSTYSNCLHDLLVLREKCMQLRLLRASFRIQYVVESFNNSSLFHKALKEAFESFCNKTVATITSAELMANFCNTLLTKVRSASVCCCGVD